MARASAWGWLLTGLALSAITPPLSTNAENRRAVDVIQLADATSEAADQLFLEAVKNARVPGYTFILPSFGWESKG
jgi:hypothetical protein